MNKEKWYEKLKAQGQSITVPMTLLMIAVAVIPLFLQTWILIGSFKQNQIEARSIEIQNQCVILSNRMTRSGYMTADKANNVSLDAQMQTIADLYNGRIVIVNSSYKIMTDTFNLSTGKYYISEEVIRCFKGESGSSFNKEGGYFYQTIPVYDPADEKITLSFDLLFKGLEVTTGGQRIHDYQMLKDKIAARGMDEEGMEQYLDTFKHGMPPHGGLGIGLERLTMQILGEENVRETCLFPRDMNRLEP